MNPKPLSCTNRLIVPLVAVAMSSPVKAPGTPGATCNDTGSGARRPDIMLTVARDRRNRCFRAGGGPYGAFHDPSAELAGADSGSYGLRRRPCRVPRGSYLHPGHRADPLQQLRRLPSPWRECAVVAQFL